MLGQFLDYLGRSAGQNRIGGLYWRLACLRHRKFDYEGPSRRPAAAHCIGIIGRIGGMPSKLIRLTKLIANAMVVAIVCRRSRSAVFNCCRLSTRTRLRWHDGTLPNRL